MSWHYSQELEGAFLPPSICSDIGLSAPSKTKASARKSSCKDSETDCSPTSPSGTTSKPSTENLGEDMSPSFRADFLVSRIRALVSNSEPQMSEIFGQTQCESFARYDPESSTLRTYPDLFPVALSSVSSKTLPKHGMMLGGVCYLLPRPWWERTIYASGGGAERPWLESDGGRSWPTPDASPRGPRAADLVVNDSTVVRRNSGQSRGIDLQTAVRHAEDNPFPTPTSSERSGINPNTGRGSGLSKFVKEGEKFPTPTAGDANSAGSRNLEGSKANAGVSLTDKVVYGNSETPREEESWPTPTARDYKDRLGSSCANVPTNYLLGRVIHAKTEEDTLNRQLSADWTDWLVGFPILWSSPDPLPVSAVQEWLTITLLHDWWAEEPPIPRTIERGGDKHRCRRLKGIGNAQVPLCAAVAYTILEIQQEASEA